MVSRSNKQITAKHFPVSGEDSFVQYTIQLTEQEYNNLTQSEEMVNKNPGKNKMLV